MPYDHILVPADGEAISVNRDHSLNVPDRPIIPYIEGDGIGIGEPANSSSWGRRRELSLAGSFQAWCLSG